MAERFRNLKRVTLVLSMLVVGNPLSHAKLRKSECPTQFSGIATTADRESFRALTHAEKLVRRRANMFSCVKTIDRADVKIDFADASLTMPITYPNGVIKYRINASGLRYIEADRPEDFYRGGVFKVQKARGFYPDGTEMTGAYHDEAWSWDVVTYKNDKNEWIALGGTMEQVEPSKLSNVARNNNTRSRWFGKVEHVEVRPGVCEEHIHWQAPLHDFNQTVSKNWINHGYGGTLVTNWNPETKIHEPL